MHPLISSIVNGTSQICEATTVVWAALIAVGIRTKVHKRSKRPTEYIDAHTLNDIGIERGSITWRR